MAVTTRCTCLCHSADGAIKHSVPCCYPPQPPVTADHTPERLSETACRAADRHCREVGEHWHKAAVERILAAHLADVKARLAAAEACADSMQHFADVAEVCERKSNDYAARLAMVEVLADEWECTPPHEGRAALSCPSCCRAKRVRDALHPDSEDD
jgi:hypothetical protein